MLFRSLDLGGDVLARVLDVAEGLVGGAVDVRQCNFPLGSDLVEDIRRDGQLGAASVDDGRVAGVFTGLLHRLLAVEHALALERPGAEPVLEVLEGLKAAGATDDLGRVVAAEQRVRDLVHLLGGDREADHGTVDDAIFAERPQVVQLSLLHVLVRGEAKDAVGVVAKALRPVEGEELEEGALVLLDLGVELSSLNSLLLVQRLNAGVVLPDEALKLGRSVCELRGSLGEDLVGLGLVHVVRHGLAAGVLLVSADEAARDGVILLEVIVTGGLIVAEHRSDGKILRAGVKDDSGRLAGGRAHVDGAEVDGVVAAVERHLQLQVVLLVDVSVGDLTDQLRGVRFSMSLRKLDDISLKVRLVLEVVRKLLQASGLVLTALL